MAQDHQKNILNTFDYRIELVGKGKQIIIPVLTFFQFNSSKPHWVVYSSDLYTNNQFRFLTSLRANWPGGKIYHRQMKVYTCTHTLMAKWTLSWTTLYLDKLEWGPCGYHQSTTTYLVGACVSIHTHTHTHSLARSQMTSQCYFHTGTRYKHGLVQDNIPQIKTTNIKILRDYDLFGSHSGGCMWM